MTIAIGKNQQVFVVLETNLDVNYELVSSSTVTSTVRLAVPASASEATTNFMLTAGEGAINQQLELLPDEQLRNGRSRRAQISGRYNPGTFTLPVYFKGGGSSSENASCYNVPEADVLLRSALGSASVSAATATHTYALNSRNPSFTLWVKKDYMVFAGVGCTCNKVKFDIKGNALAMATYEGEFMQMIKGGSTYLAKSFTSASATTLTSVEVPHGASDQFDIGMTIKIGTGSGSVNTNTSLGYKISDIVRGATSADNDVLSFACATSGFATELATVVSGTATPVVGYIPFSDHVTQVERGTPIHGKRGLLIVSATDGTDVIENIFILSATIDINSNVKYSVDEKNGTFYPKDYFTSDFRDVSGNMKLYLRESNVKFWKDAFSRKTYRLELPVGDVAGNIVTINCPKIEIESPSISGANEIEMDVSFKAIMTSVADDELTVTFE